MEIGAWVLEDENTALLSQGHRCPCTTGKPHLHWRLLDTVRLSQGHMRALWEEEVKYLKAEVKTMHVLKYHFSIQGCGVLLLTVTQGGDGADTGGN